MTDLLADASPEFPGEAATPSADALATARRRLDAALLAGEVGTFEWDTQGQRVWGDANFARMFGIPLDADGQAPLGRYIDVIHPDDRTRMQAAVARTVQHGADYEIEYRVLGHDADGRESERWLLVRAKPERDALGRVVRAAGVCLDVTDRKRAEAALQRSEARWTAAIEHFAEGVIIATAAEQVIYWNPAARRLHGLTSDGEGIGPLAEAAATFELWTPDGARRLGLDEWPMRRIQRGEPVRALELRLRRLDQGWEKHVAYSGAMVETAAGERLIFLSVHDLTERVQAEAARRMAEALYREVFDNIELAFHRCEIVTDAQGAPVDLRILDVNPAWARATGHDPVAAIGKLGRELAPTLEPEWIAACGRAALGREHIRMEQHFAHLGKWYDVHLVPFGPPELRQFLATAADITARKRVEAALRRGDEQLRVALDAADAGAWRWIADRDELRWDDRCYDHHGLPPGRALTIDDWLGCLIPEDRPMAQRRLAALLEESAAVDWRVEFRVRHPTRGERWLLALGRAERDAAGRVVQLAGITLDATDRRAAEQRLALAQRMEAAGRLAGGIAHEANNQMTVVLGATDFLLRRPGIDAEAREDLAQIRAAAERTAGISRQLLAFTRQQVLQPQPLDADAVVAGLGPLLARTLGPAVSCVTALGAPGATVLADKGQLEQVLLNLALNARDAMTHGGTFSLTSSIYRLEAARVRAESLAVQPGPCWRLLVRDTGTGIPAAVRAHIFEPFFTTKPLTHGSGLGLSVVLGVLRQSGGDVTVTSAEGMGTTFELLLPLQSALAAASAADDGTAGAAGRAQGGPPLVLVVEDEPSVRWIAERSLREAGYRVLAVADGAEALAQLERPDVTPPACAVLDVMMPGMQGPEVALALRARWPALPVLFMSGYAPEEVEGVSEVTGASFLEKPFAPEALGRRVGELLQARAGE